MLKKVFISECEQNHDTKKEQALSITFLQYDWFISKMNEGVVSKETVVLRRWGSSIQKFRFINGVDNVNWPPYRDSKS